MFSVYERFLSSQKSTFAIYIQKRSFFQQEELFPSEKFWFLNSHPLVSTLTKKARLDEMLVHFFGSLVRYTIIAVTIITVLNQAGIQTASLLAVLASAGLAIGLALQGTLANVSAGVMLVFFRPFSVGQYVEVAGKAGRFCAGYFV